MSSNNSLTPLIIGASDWLWSGRSAKLKAKMSYINIVSTDEFVLSIYSQNEISSVLENNAYSIRRVSKSELRVERKGKSTFKSSYSLLIKLDTSLDENNLINFDLISYCSNQPMIYLGHELKNNDYFIRKTFSTDEESVKRRKVFFTSFGLDNQPLQNFEFLNFIGDRDIDALFLRDNTRHWFQGGILGFSRSKDDTIYNIEKYLDDCSDVEFIGVSMGGFAALVYGLILKVKKIIVISPQTRLDKKFRGDIGDKRWKKYLDYVESNMQSYNLRNCLKQNSTTSVEIFVSNHDSLDMAHVEDIVNFKNVKVNIVDFRDHYLARELAKTGVLTKIIFGESK